jgi:hypothetical protein
VPSSNVPTYHTGNLLNLARVPTSSGQSVVEADVLDDHLDETLKRTSVLVINKSDQHDVPESLVSSVVIDKPELVAEDVSASRVARRVAWTRDDA